MSDYNSNYEIAQAISERVGAQPIPFDSVYEICLEIYNELGGEPSEFDSVYEILLGILPLVEGGIASKIIDDNSIVTNKTWSSSKIAAQIADAGFDVEIVQSLPVSGDTHTIYFVPVSGAAGSDVYNEFMYISGSWEQIGSTRIDLSNYYTKSETNTLLDGKADVYSIATIQEINQLFTPSN